jgi:hypothetical protein
MASVNAINVCIDAIILDEPACDAIDVRCETFVNLSRMMGKKARCLRMLSELPNNAISAMSVTFDDVLNTIESNDMLFVGDVHWSQLVYNCDEYGMIVLEENLEKEDETIQSVESDIEQLSKWRVERTVPVDDLWMEYVKIVVTNKACCYEMYSALLYSLSKNIDNFDAFINFTVICENDLLKVQEFTNKRTFIVKESLRDMMVFYAQLIYEIDSGLEILSSLD